MSQSARDRAANAAIELHAEIPEIENSPDERAKLHTNIKAQAEAAALQDLLLSRPQEFVRRFEHDQVGSETLMLSLTESEDLWNELSDALNSFSEVAEEHLLEIARRYLEFRVDLAEQTGDSFDVDLAFEKLVEVLDLNCESDTYLELSDFVSDLS